MKGLRALGRRLRPLMWLALAAAVFAYAIRPLLRH
jgi:hypothetical protein